MAGLPARADAVPAFRVYKSPLRAAAKRRWSRDWLMDYYAQEDIRYSGTICTMPGHIYFYDQQYQRLEEAQRFCLERHIKWDCPVACSFTLTTPLLTKTREVPIRQKIKAAEARLLEVRYQARREFGRGRSKIILCGGCTQRFSRRRMVEERISPFACPSCGHTLLELPARNRIAAAESVIQDLRTELAEFQQTVEPVLLDKLAWVVGGWAACHEDEEEA